MKRIRYLALAAMVAFAACDEEGAPIVDVTPETGSVAGSVTAGGVGIGNLTVTLAGASSQSVATGSNGSFSFNNVAVGNYAVTISGVTADFACSVTSQTVTVTANQTANVSFTCNVVMTASISGTVSRGVNPLPAAGITITRTAPAPAGSAQFLQTGINGQYSLTGLRSGTYSVVLTQPAGVACSVNTQTVNLLPGQAQVVNFACAVEPPPPPPPPAQPVVTIQSITVPGMFAGTTVPANPDSLAGRVEVTVNIDPRGNDLLEYRLMARDESGVIYELCHQTFASAAPAAVAGVDTPQTITCSWSTDRMRSRLGGSTVKTSNAVNGVFAAISDNVLRPHHPVFLNGEYDLIARVVVADAAPVTATVDVTLINSDAVVLGVRSNNDNGGTTGFGWGDPASATGAAFPNFRIDATTGLRWLSGDVILTVFPVIYSREHDPNNPVLTRAGFQFNGFRTGTNTMVGAAFLPGTTPAPAANGTFTFVFCEAPSGSANDGSACYARIHAFNTGDIGARAMALQTVTTFGQFGPNLSDVKTIFFFDADLQSGTRGTLNDVLRIDNEAPVAPSIALTGHPVPGFSRWGGSAGSAGWLNWTYSFAGGWTAPTSDNPFVYPVGGPGPDQIAGTSDDGPWCDSAGDLCRSNPTPLMGIGLPSPASSARQVFHVGPDALPGRTPAQVVPVLGSFVGLVTTGANLTAETDSPGLSEAGSAPGTPFSDTENDYAIAGRAWDLFGNAINSNVIYVGVDGRAPIFTVGPNDPTSGAPTIYNTYGNVGAYGSGKTPGQYMGTTSDTGNGFSGVAGIELEDWENACAAGVFACMGTMRNFRGASGSSAPAAGNVTGKKVQPIAPGGATFPLAWIFDAGPTGAGMNNICGILCPAFGDDSHELFAYDPPFATVPGDSHDGYRQQQVITWDRAGNFRFTDAIVTEHIGDKTRPVVGNVQMPTVPTFILGAVEAFGGRVQDRSDLKISDLSFDFHGITTLQTWLEPIPGEGMPLDADAVAFTSLALQLPLMNQNHTAFGSGQIMLDVNLAASVPFLGCLRRFDEMAVNATRHRPRGPRWRSWDHASLYGLTNTQHNSFTISSVPSCPSAGTFTSGLIPAVGGVGVGPDGIASTADDGAGPDGVFGTPDDDIAWQFITGTGGAPMYILKGSSAGFVPNALPDNLWLYYIDSMGRARLWNTGSQNWTLNVRDYGTGAYGRAYEWTYTGALPGDVTAGVSAGAPNGWFFVLYRPGTSGSNAGIGLIWDETVTP